MNTITQADIDNIRKLEQYMKTPRTAGEVATYLNISRMKALDYIEIMLKNPKKYPLTCGNLAGVEKTWVIE